MQAKNMSTSSCRGQALGPKKYYGPGQGLELVISLKLIYQALFLLIYNLFSQQSRLYQSYHVHVIPLKNCVPISSSEFKPSNVYKTRYL